MVKQAGIGFIGKLVNTAALSNVDICTSVSDITNLTTKDYMNKYSSLFDGTIANLGKKFIGKADYEAKAKASLLGAFRRSYNQGLKSKNPQIKNLAKRIKECYKKPKPPKPPKGRGYERLRNWIIANEPRPRQLSGLIKNWSTLPPKTQDHCNDLAEWVQKYIERWETLYGVYRV